MGIHSYRMSAYRSQISLGTYYTYTAYCHQHKREEKRKTSLTNQQWDITAHTKLLRQDIGHAAMLYCQRLPTSIVIQVRTELFDIRDNSPSSVNNEAMQAVS